MANLGVNIDHVATIRQARGTQYPDPVEAAVLAQLGGADQITVHLREDRRHIIDRDVRLLRSVLQVPLNLEMACTHEMVRFALEIKPDMVTLVPEKREERTTEGGLEVAGQIAPLTDAVRHLQSAGIPCSLFIEPDEAAVDATLRTNAQMVEFHTGRYSELTGTEQSRELTRITAATAYGHGKGLAVHAGHGLNFRNVIPVARVPHMQDLNIGHSIVARAVLVGLERAVREMKDLIQK
ncbi:MAG: pyridoxine 5'-phosphate synthase [Proteobacteria bacterium]|nr:pyridoxine 5'-phosphate synthase [Pseudomonadota bacterium]